MFIMKWFEIMSQNFDFCPTVPGEEGRQQEHRGKPLIIEFVVQVGPTGQGDAEMVAENGDGVK